MEDLLIWEAGSCLLVLAEEKRMDTKHLCKFCIRGDGCSAILSLPLLVVDDKDLLEVAENLARWE